jgi:hypothetical protein
MISDLVHVASRDYEARQVLAAIAAGQPQDLAPYLIELLDRQVLWPPFLFRAAGRNVVSEIVRRIDAGGLTGMELSRLLLILAHTRDELAEAALRRWQAVPPPGTGELRLDVAALAKQGGWVLTGSEAARELCAPVAYRLMMRPSTGTADGENCPWCESPLWTVVELDTGWPEAARALAHAGWSGRLRITACLSCSHHTPLFCTVTPAGSSSWSPHNRRPDHLGLRTGAPPALLPAIGAQRQTPYLASAWESGGSTLGGEPDWIQDGNYLDCPACGQPMDYIGLVAGVDLGSGYPGAHYMFLHALCGLAAVCHQRG